MTDAPTPTQSPGEALAIQVLDWTMASNREGMESPNYALEQAEPEALLDVVKALTIATRIDPLNAAKLTACLSARELVEREILRRMTPASADDLFG